MSEGGKAVPGLLAARQPTIAGRPATINAAASARVHCTRGSGGKGHAGECDEADAKGDNHDCRHKAHGLPPSDKEPPNGWRASGESSRAQGATRVRCTPVSGGLTTCEPLSNDPKRVVIA